MATFGKCCFLIVWTILFTTFFAKTQALLPCDYGWELTPGAGDCVKLFDNKKKSWYDARQACKSTGGDLVTIRDKDMSNFIKEKFVYNNKNPIWIGLRNIRGGKRLHWLDENVPPTYTEKYVKPRLPFWRYLEDLCVTILKNRNKREAAWHGSKCDADLQYICEKPIPFRCYFAGWIIAPKSQLCVKIFHREAWRMTWSKARWWCQKLNGDLVTIRDDTMRNFIRDRIVADINVSSWIGLHKSNDTLKWHWLDEDETPTYTNWAFGYPFLTEEACAGVKKIDGQGTPWHTFNCSVERGVICEGAPPPHCYYKSKIYRHGSYLTMKGECGNPYRCIRDIWRHSVDKCRWHDGSCLALNEKRGHYTCRKDRHGTARLIYG
ncbi:macrophage mannose receptor 1 [Plakobranchus ocellatus]|uniref:Macrophage mannose receptor 1 n=1 Tax=Plakobranchus ocellatus TaxID=259542 RepID=A0AAV4ATV3_9GAST|nr:macrophage mannose receptor 1 [Plakobranchus ocellatus]